MSLNFKVFGVLKIFLQWEAWVRPMLSDRCLSVLSVTLVYCGQTIGWIKMALGTQVGLGPGHIVQDEDPAPLPKKGVVPPSQFSAHFYCIRFYTLFLSFVSDYLILFLPTHSSPAHVVQWSNHLGAMCSRA